MIFHVMGFKGVIAGKWEGNEMDLVCACVIKTICT